MANVQTLCSVFKQNLLKGVENFNTGTPYTYKIALYTSLADLNASTTAYTTDNEVTGIGYTAGGIALTPLTPGLTVTTAFQSFNDVTWTPA